MKHEEWLGYLAGAVVLFLIYNKFSQPQAQPVGDIDLSTANGVAGYRY